MFCGNCGTQMNDDAKFCGNCGTSVVEVEGNEKVQTKTIIEDNTIKFQLKPEFKVVYKLVQNIRNAIVLYIILGFMFGLHEILLEYPESLPVVIPMSIGIAVLYIVGKMIFDKLQHKYIEYNFYTTKLEYKDGFLDREEKELKYKYVREVTMSQSILERLFNIGTIHIYTNATSSNNGIWIHCIENVQEQYKTIKQIIDEGTEK